MTNRPPANITVLVYKPLITHTEDFGWVAAAYPLALLASGEKTYLIDPFGCGTPPLENPEGFYQLPVYDLKDPEDVPTPSYQAPIVGFVGITQDRISIMNLDSGQDLAKFIWPGPACDQRLDHWMELVREGHSSG